MLEKVFGSELGIDLVNDFPEEINFSINSSIVRVEQKIFARYHTSNLKGYDAENFRAEFDLNFELVTNKSLLARNGNTVWSRLTCIPRIY